MDAIRRVKIHSAAFGTSTLCRNTRAAAPTERPKHVTSKKNLSLALRGSERSKTRSVSHGNCFGNHKTKTCRARLRTKRRRDQYVQLLASNCTGDVHAVGRYQSGSGIAPNDGCTY